MKVPVFSDVRHPRSGDAGRARAVEIWAVFWCEFHRAMHALALYQELSRASDHALAARGLRRSEIASFVKRTIYSEN